MIDEYIASNLITEAIRKLGRPAPVIGEYKHVSYTKILRAIEWATARIKDLETEVERLTKEPQEATNADRS